FFVGYDFDGDHRVAIRLQHLFQCRAGEVLAFLLRNTIADGEDGGGLRAMLGHCGFILPQGLKPTSLARFNAGLKACSTQSPRRGPSTSLGVTVDLLLAEWATE